MLKRALAVALGWLGADRHAGAGAGAAADGDVAARLRRVRVHRLQRLLLRHFRISAGPKTLVGELLPDPPRRPTTCSGTPASRRMVGTDATPALTARFARRDRRPARPDPGPARADHDRRHQPLSFRSYRPGARLPAGAADHGRRAISRRCAALQPGIPREALAPLADRRRRGHRGARATTTFRRRQRRHAQPARPHARPSRPAGPPRLRPGPALRRPLSFHRAGRSAAACRRSTPAAPTRWPRWTGSTGSAATCGAKVVIQHEPADVAKLPAFPASAR